jgi:hypothetical protein
MEKELKKGKRNLRKEKERGRGRGKRNLRK